MVGWQPSGVSANKVFHSIYVRYFLFTYSLSVNNIFQIRLVIRMIEIMDSHLGLRFGLEIRLRIGMGIGIWDLK